jgi:hypothetical protein
MENTHFSSQPSESNQFNQNDYQPHFVQLSVPNSAAVLILGILSIVLCFCYGLIGLILGIIALVLASKANALYKANPGMYSLSSYNNLKAGKICAIIGVVLSSLYLIFIVVYILFLGALFSVMPWDAMSH